MGIGDWGLGIGDLGVWAITQNPKPKTQTPKTPKNILKKIFFFFFLFFFNFI